MMISIIILIIGLMICGGGLYYFRKEKEDKASRKIYLTAVFIGILMVVGAIVRLCI